MARSKQTAHKHPNPTGGRHQQALAGGGKRKTLSAPEPAPPAKKTAAKKPVAKKSVPAAAGIPKKRRFRPGTVALREIRKQQQGTRLLIPKLSFARLAREIAQDAMAGDDTKKLVRWQATAFAALHEAAEDYLTSLFDDTQDNSLFRGARTISVKDMRHTMRMRAKDAANRPTEVTLYEQAPRIAARPSAAVKAAVADDDGDADDGDADDGDAADGSSSDGDVESGSDGDSEE